MKTAKATVFTSRWIYQMSEKVWKVENYRREIEEKETLIWPINRKLSKEYPAPGDLIYCYYAESNKYPGIYGWGLVLKHFPETRRFRWRPLEPTKQLMHDPWWDDTLKEMIFHILGDKNQRRATMFPISSTLETIIRRGLFTWTY